MPKRPTKPKSQKSQAPQRPLSPRARVRQSLSILLLPLWVFIALYGAQFFLALVLSRFISYDTLLTPLWSAIYSALVYLLALALIIFVPTKLFKVWRTSPEELGLTGLPTWTDLALAPVGLVISLLLGTGLIYLFSLLFPDIDPTQSQDLLGFATLTSNLDRLLAFVSLVVLAPMAEELIFRGWLYGKLRGKLPGQLSLPLAMLLVSALFGLVHGQWNVGLTVFAMSLVSCAFREITGTAYAGILLHMLKNGVAFVLLYVFMIQ